MKKIIAGINAFRRYDAQPNRELFERLATARIAAGDQRLHGWYYDIASGRMLRHDEARRAFVDLEADEAHGRSAGAIDDTAPRPGLA
jgi:hypothetical protein